MPNIEFYKMLKSQGKLKPEDEMPDIVYEQFYINSFFDLKYLSGEIIDINSMIKYTQVYEIKNAKSFIRIISKINSEFISWLQMIQSNK